MYRKCDFILYFNGQMTDKLNFCSLVSGVCSMHKCTKQYKAFYVMNYSLFICNILPAYCGVINANEYPKQISRPFFWSSNGLLYADKCNALAYGTRDNGKTRHFKQTITGHIRAAGSIPRRPRLRW